MLKVLFHILFILSILGFANDGFLKEQRHYKRFRVTEKEKLEDVKSLFRSKNVEFSNSSLFLRAFKREAELELWAKSNIAEQYSLIRTYKICSSSGKLGPKRKQGDLQVPEGVYFIDRFNPSSNFYLSLGLNYPNKSDRILGAKGKLGGDIFIHGRCVTIGCIPITDEFIKELYLICVYLKDFGQEKIPVHIFPTRMNNTGIQYLAEKYQDKILEDFWQNLERIYVSFQETKVLPIVTVDKSGQYLVNGS